MMGYVLQNLILEPWTILDLATPPAPLTGMTSPADITFTLHRQSGSTFVAAAETVGFAETASAGTYAITFTPQTTGYYMLQLTELNVNTLQRTYRFSYEVLPAGAVFSPTFTNAYCAETDVERYCGLSFTATSAVTSTQAAGFAEERATVLTTLIAGWGVTITPATVTAGSRLEDLLRAANAIGAGLDAVIAWYQGVEPSRVEKATSLLEQWTYYVGGVLDGKVVVGVLEKEALAQVGHLGTDHILSGDTTARISDNAPVDVGFQVRMGDLY